jgi:sulfate adenylyltransferase
MELQQKTKTDTNGLIPPYGGELKNLIIKDKNLKNKLISKVTYEFECSERNACDVELLMVGAFSPLEGFMDENNYNSVIKNNRNTSGLLFGLPIVFDSNNEEISVGETILLTYKKQKIAVLEVSSKWEPDKSLESELCV